MFEHLGSRLTMPPAMRPLAGKIAVAVAFIAALSYGLHERSVAARYSEQSTQASLQAQDLRANVQTLSAKLDSLADRQAQLQEAPAAKAAQHPAGQHPVLRSGASHQKPDPRWKKLQAQVDAQGKDIESTRQAIASTRSDLEGSIARTHEELVVLEKKGERNYLEFDLDKSKNFRQVGPVGVSLRKANTKHQYADLELLVDDRQLSKKHLNLYEPAVFYPGGDRQAVELVVMGVTKNHIHGYISAPKYNASELAAASTTGAPDSAGGLQTDPAKTRRKLEVPR